MKILHDYNLEELTCILKEMSEPSFRAKQLFLNLQSFKSYGEMTNIPNSLKEKLALTYIDKSVEIIEHLHSLDGTIKFLFKLYDGNIIEGVLMKYKYGNTQCVSSQVGCRMGCKFCASTIGGLVRNLSSGEILGQILAVNRFLNGTVKDREVTNVVLMGSGEPLDNYNNVVHFLKNLTSENSLNISARNISLSTCGLVDKIHSLANENLPLNLTISLHNPFDSERQLVMPIANKFSIKEILQACNFYFERTKRRYIFEYVLIKNVTDTLKHAQKLIEILKGKPCHVNIIRLNEVKENNLQTVTEKDAFKFISALVSGGLSATLRRQIGVDIEGACGQLRRKYIGEES